MRSALWKKLAIIIFIIFCPFQAAIAEALSCEGKYKGYIFDAAKLQSLIASAIPPSPNLCGATLAHIDLQNLQLSEADLSGADMSQANLQHINLSHANLRFTFFRWSNLTKGNFERANLEKAILSNTVLNDANFKYANMKNVNLAGADLSGANLSFANLEGANLSNTNLTGADLRFANLKNVDLSHANLQDANLEGAFLISAKLQQTNLKNANLSEVDLSEAIYQPQLNNLPDLIAFLSVKNFRSIHFEDANTSRAVLTELRNAYMLLGVSRMEHFITSIIKYHEMLDGWVNGGWAFVESTLGYVFFYLTSDYGWAPIRPIKILLFGILFFSIPYRIALSRASKHAGIVAVWLPQRFYHWDKVKKIRSVPFLASKLLNTDFIATKQNKIAKQIQLFGLALFFSLLSAFSIGWKDINVGNWISHLQAREYALKGKGWVRAVAGFQSLLSAYLIVLWILCYFGRPFEW